MKKFMMIVLLSGLLGCEEPYTQAADLPDPQPEYFKDWSTGLCFAKVTSVTYGGRVVMSLACVPCDSIKNFK